MKMQHFKLWAVCKLSNAWDKDKLQKLLAPRKTTEKQLKTHMTPRWLISFSFNNKIFQFLDRWFQWNLAAHGLLWFWQLPLLWRPLSVLNTALESLFENNPMYLGNLLELGASAATAFKTSDLLSPGAKSDASTMHWSMCSDLFATRNAANTEHFPTCSCHFHTKSRSLKAVLPTRPASQDAKVETLHNFRHNQMQPVNFIQSKSRAFSKAKRRSVCLQVSTMTRLWSRPWVHSVRQNSFCRILSMFWSTSCDPNRVMVQPSQLDPFLSVVVGRHRFSASFRVFFLRILRQDLEISK